MQSAAGQFAVLASRHNFACTTTSCKVCNFQMMLGFTSSVGIGNMDSFSLSIHNFCNGLAWCSEL